MLLSNLLRECLDTATLECWERERTATPVRAFAVRLHATGCSLRETKAILALLGVKRSHQAIFQWVHRVSDSVLDPPSATPTRVAVDETAVKINGEWSWVYAAIDTETKLLLDVKVFGRHGTDQAAAFLADLAEKHDLSNALFLVDGYGLSDCPLSRWIARSARLHRAKPDRKVVSHAQTADRPLPYVVGGQSAERPALA